MATETGNAVLLCREEVTCNETGRSAAFAVDPATVKVVVDDDDDDEVQAVVVIVEEEEEEDAGDCV